MRVLIRPTLFIIARTTLLLAVVIWAVGQWKAVVVSVSLVRAASCETGWAIVGYSGVDTGWHFDVVPARDTLPVNNVFRSDRKTFPVSTHGIHFSFLQLRWFSAPLKGGVFAITHWLVATFLLCFNILLHFIYRNHSEDSHDE